MKNYFSNMTLKLIISKFSFKKQKLKTSLVEFNMQAQQYLLFKLFIYLCKPIIIVSNVQ